MARRRRFPALLRRQVFDRDRGVCAICALDAEALRRELMEVDVEARTARQKALRWPAHRMDYWDADHVVAFAEGGECALENMRTLCLPCHAKVTAELMTRLDIQIPPWKAKKQDDGWRDMPAGDGGWWISRTAQEIECGRCGEAFDDRPCVMRYVAALDTGGLTRMSERAWASNGWAVWREHDRCGWQDFRSETATTQQIRAWDIGPWRPTEY